MRELRVATLADLDALEHLDRACFSRPWAGPAWASELAGGSVWVAGEPLHACVCAPIVLDRCEVRRISVEPSWRRQGVGQDLLLQVIQRAQESACTRVELEVGAGNEAAVELYRSLGFECVGRRPGYYTQPPDDALLFDLALTTDSPQNDD